MKRPTKSELEQAVVERGQTGLLREFWDFLCFNKKWWLLPIVLVLFLLGLVVLLTSSAAAPFIYTLF
jgi:hypothetical protein